jgi:hypothetical protein
LSQREVKPKIWSSASVRKLNKRRRIKTLSRNHSRKIWHANRVPLQASLF